MPDFGETVAAAQVGRPFGNYVGLGAAVDARTTSSVGNTT